MILIKQLTKYYILDQLSTKFFIYLSIKTNIIKKNDIPLYNSYLTSLIYSIYLGYRSINHFQISLQCNHINYSQLCMNEMINMKKTNKILLAHLIFDLFKVILYFPKLGKYDIIFHHILYSFASILLMFYKVNMLPGAWIGLSEISTIFLNLKFFLKLFRLHKTKLYSINNFLFIISFCIFRILTWIYGINKLVNESNYITKNNTIKYYIFSIILSGFILNLFWFTKILIIIKKTYRQC